MHNANAAALFPYCHFAAAFWLATQVYGTPNTSKKQRICCTRRASSVLSQAFCHLVYNYVQSHERSHQEVTIHML